MKVVKCVCCELHQVVLRKIKWTQQLYRDTSCFETMHAFYIYCLPFIEQKCIKAMKIDKDTGFVF